MTSTSWSLGRLLSLVANRRSDDFQQSIDEEKIYKRAKYEVLKPLLQSADKLYIFLCIMAKTAGDHPKSDHFWWPGLKHNLDPEKGDLEFNMDFISNLAYLFLEWKVPVAPFVHAVCRIAAEYSRTVDDGISETSNSDEGVYYGAEVRPWHKLHARYWRTLVQLLPALMRQMVTLSGSTASRLSLKLSESNQLADDDHWTAAIKFAATVQCKLNRHEMIDGLVAMLNEFVDRDEYLAHTPPMQNYVTLQKQADRRRTTAGGMIGPESPESQQRWETKKQMALKKSREYVAQTKADLQRLIKEEVHRQTLVVVQPITFIDKLPGNIQPSTRFPAKVDRNQGLTAASVPIIQGVVRSAAAACAVQEVPPTVLATPLAVSSSCVNLHMHITSSSVQINNVAGSLADQPTTVTIAPPGPAATNALSHRQRNQLSLERAAQDGNIFAQDFLSMGRRPPNQAVSGKRPRKQQLDDKQAKQRKVNSNKQPKKVKYDQVKNGNDWFWVEAIPSDDSEESSSCSDEEN